MYNTAGPDARARQKLTYAKIRVAKVHLTAWRTIESLLSLQNLTVRHLYRLDPSQKQKHLHSLVCADTSGRRQCCIGLIFVVASFVRSLKSKALQATESKTKRLSNNQGE